MMKSILKTFRFYTDFIKSNEILVGIFFSYIDIIYISTDGAKFYVNEGVNV